MAPVKIKKIKVPNDISYVRDVTCPRNNYVPARHRLVYKKFNKTCRYFRDDPSSLEIYGFCTSKKMHILTERTITSVNDIGLECCNNCPFFSLGKKVVLVWVHITNHSRVNEKMYYDGNKYYTKKTKKIRNDMLCIAKNGDKWSLMYIYKAKLFNLAFVSYSRKKYTRLIGRKTK